MKKTISITGKKLDENAVAFPCGLIASSIFTDSYTITSSSNNQII